MKKKLLCVLIAFVMVVTMMPMMAFADEEDNLGVPITVEYFPDEAFRQILIDSVYNLDHDEFLTDHEIADLVQVDLNNQVKNLEGIQYLTRLVVLDLKGNGDVSIPQFPESLSGFICDNCNLTTLPALPSTLNRINAQGNKLSGILDLSGFKNLKFLNLSLNNLEGVILNSQAPYQEINLEYNYIIDTDKIVGRSDIVWSNEYGKPFIFGIQRVCDIIGHDMGNSYKCPAYVGQEFSESGGAYSYCSRCSYSDYKETIPAIKTIKLSKTAYTYDGKEKKPTVIVKDSKGKTVSTKKYTVKYATGRKMVGAYKVTVTFKGNLYQGSRQLTYKINPKATTLSSVAKAKKAFTVKWKKQASKTSTGYQIRYSTSSSMKAAKLVSVKGYSKTSYKVSKLKAKKKYYVQIRTYKVVKGVEYVSNWSKAKAVTAL